eukprot:767127-Hanusia_phi.AAC.1
MSEEQDQMIPPLNVLKSGQSYQFNCLGRDGIVQLRTSVCKEAKKLLWWKELIPAAVLRLEEEVGKRSQLQKKAMIDMQEYMSLVHAAKVVETSSESPGRP